LEKLAPRQPNSTELTLAFESAPAPWVSVLVIM
jgi:hypothetical protein